MDEKDLEELGQALAEMVDLPDWEWHEETTQKVLDIVAAYCHCTTQGAFETLAELSRNELADNGRELWWRMDHGTGDQE